MIENLIARLFYLRTIAHTAHLKESSYARHMALGSFYDQIATDADAIAEAWMGRNLEKVGDIPIVADAPTASIINDIRKVRTWIDLNRKDKSLSDSEVQNLIDEATATIDAVLYKLKFLS